MLVVAALLAGWSAAAPGFVRASTAGFTVDGRPYHFVGANVWYGMNLGASAPGGDPARLRRELDRLHALGADNLRVMGLTEGPDDQPWRIVPALQGKPGLFDERLLKGLDLLLAEMGRRGQRAVITLNDFWPWSGGMGQYLVWSRGGQIPYPPPQPGGDWQRYQRFAAGFYGDAKAQRLWRDAVRMLVKRHNSVTGARYRDDPTIMAWELANEPRGDADAVALEAWIDSSARFIKSIDPSHLVATGCEGDSDAPGRNGLDFARDNASSAVDYATIHVWAQNWYWYDPAKPGETLAPATDRMRSYVRGHAQRAAALGKPLVIEEFGLARASGSFEATAATREREAYEQALLDEALALSGSSTPVAGLNFWAWAGEARPIRPGQFWRPGDPWIGDPPHERQGWYSVYDTDAAAVAAFMRLAVAWRTADGLPPRGPDQ